MEKAARNIIFEWNENNASKNLTFLEIQLAWFEVNPRMKGVSFSAGQAIVERTVTTLCFGAQRWRYDVEKRTMAQHR